MENIVFGGCSFTWGQSLWYHANFENDNHPRDGFFYGNMICPECKKYMEDNRFASKVANYFRKKSIVKAINGGSNMESIRFCKNAIDENTKLVIIQTTQFLRDVLKIDEQIEKLEEFVQQTESKGIPVRFIHWVWPDITEEEIESVKSNNSKIKYRNIFVPSFSSSFETDSFKSILPPNDSNKLCSKIIRERTIRLDNEFNFNGWTEPHEIERKYKKNMVEEIKKRAIFGWFEVNDTHFSQHGHDIVAKSIINYIEENKLFH